MFKLLITLFISGFIASCGSLSKKDDDAGSSSNKPTLEQLAGTWKNPCLSSTDLSYQTVLTYQNDKLDKFVIYYSDAKCQSESEFFRYTYKSDHVSVKDTTELQGYTSYRMRYIAVEAMFSKEHRLFKEFNEKKRWSYSDWKIAETKDLSGKVFEENCKDCSARKVNDVRVQSVRIDENGRLNFANYKDGKTATLSTDLEDQYERQ